MYYVNREGITRRLACIPELAAALAELSSAWKGTLIQGLAQERCLHLGLEIVTDVGSFLIDGFMMRDASSYEDIIEVISGEGVLPLAQANKFRELVALRRPLVQDYDGWPRSEKHPLTDELGTLLIAFAEEIKAYLHKELDPWEAPR